MFDGDLPATLPGNSVFTAGTGGRRNQEASIQPQTEIQTLGMLRWVVAKSDKPPKG